jgi:hypothetical protein
MINARHRAIVNAVAKAVREGIKGVVIRDDERIKKFCQHLTQETGALLRPDLVYESYAVKRGKGHKISNLTEITSTWPWEDSLDRAYRKKREKCVRLKMETQKRREYSKARLHVIIVTPTGAVYQQSLKELAAATCLPRIRLEVHTRPIADAAADAAHDHYRQYCRAMKASERVKGALRRYREGGRRNRR